MPQALNICELEIFTARLRELRFNEQQKERHNESNNQGCYYISRN